MTAFENIVNAIASFGYPYKPDVYQGDCEKYFVYNYAGFSAGTLWADDEPGSCNSQCPGTLF